MADLGRAALNKASKVPAVAPTHSSGAEKNGQLMPETAMISITSSLDHNIESSGQQQPFLNQENGTRQASNLFPESLVSTPTRFSPALGFENTVSPDWLNFDTAFENFDAVLGSSGADLSMELLRPFNFEAFGSHDLAG